MKKIDPAGITEEQKKAQIEAMWKKHEEGKPSFYSEDDYYDNPEDELDIDFEDY